MAPLLALASLGILLPLGAASMEEPEDEVSLLQNHLGVKASARSSQSARESVKESGAQLSDARGKRQLAFMHVPFNFGHSVEHVAMFGSGPLSTASMMAYLFSLGGFAGLSRRASWAEVKRMTRPGGEVWGHLNPDLQWISEATGCEMYYTPQKYWPQDLAAEYFGNKTVFGLLRDPYERLIAFARGGVHGYGGTGDYMNKSKCNVNSAVKQMMKDYIAGSDKFKDSCTYLPQAEYFDGPYGITLPVNNREFPASMNEVFADQGYPYMRVDNTDVIHVVNCPNVWAGDLDAETRGLVKQVYKRDFDLLCKHFGYCDREENACIYQVPLMCPSWLMELGYRGRPLPNVSQMHSVGPTQRPRAAHVSAQEVLRMATHGRLSEDILMRLAVDRKLLEELATVISQT